MGPLYRMVTWYKNTLQEGKQYSGTLKRKDIVTDVIYLFFLPNSTACHPSRGVVVPSDRFFQGFIRIHKKNQHEPSSTKFSGADPGFFLGGGALVSCSTSTPINHIVSFSFFFCRIPVVLENRRSSQWGVGGCTLPVRSP